MNAFNRVFVALLALLWIAAWSGIIYLMWEPGRELSESNSYFEFLFDISVTGSDRVLGTVIAGAAIFFGLAMLAAEFMPRRGRVRDRGHEDVPSSDPRYRELHERINELERQVADRDVDRRPVAPGEPVTSSEERYRSERPRRWSVLGRNR